MPTSTRESDTRPELELLPLKETPWRRLLSLLAGMPRLPLVIIIIMIVAAIFAHKLAPHNPELGLLSDRFLPPLSEGKKNMFYLLGTDHIGRDVLSRLIFGARISVVVSLTATFAAAFIGTLIGIVSGYMGKWVDQVIMRLVDTWISIPTLSIAIFLAVILGPSILNIIIIMTAVFWTRFTRVVRGEVLSLKERDYVRLAMVAGCSKKRIMFKHIFPNVLNSAVVLGTLMIGVVIIAEASLSFLGVGVPPPKPAWGLMLSDGKRGLMAGYWWLTVFPGLAIMSVVLAANLLGDWLRVRLDPQLRQL